MKKFLAILLASILLLSFTACGDEKEDEAGNDSNNTPNTDLVMTEGDFEYSVNEDGDYEIVGYIGSDANIEIPSKMQDERPVTGIGANAFRASTVIKTVKIPDTVEYIGAQAFYDCDLIEAITLPDSVTLIEADAFEDCSALKTVKLSTAITSIENYAFKDCKVLKSITLPETLTNIGDAAFWNCEALTEVTIPAAVKYVGKTAFNHCINLEKVTVNTTDAEIDTAAFMDCEKLTYTEYENGKYLGNKDNPYIVFAKVIDTTVSELNFHKDTKIIAAYAIANCTLVESVDIPEGVKTLSADVFEDCISLEYVIIPKSLKTIGANAFKNCDKLTTEKDDKEMFNVFSRSTPDSWDPTKENIVSSHSTNLMNRENIYFYTETELVGSPFAHWHLVEGVPTVWSAQ